LKARKQTRDAASVRKAPTTPRRGPTVTRFCDKVEFVGLGVQIPANPTRCLIWILSAFLILATLDRIPDPAAARRNGSSQYAAIHFPLVDTAEPPPSVFVPAAGLVVVGVEPAHSAGLVSSVALLERAGDASPPRPF
jgi:hypothetical protein